MPAGSPTPPNSRPKLPQGKDSTLTEITTSSSTSSSKSPSSPFTPGSPRPRTEYFEEPQPMNNGPTSPASTSSRWLPRLRSKSPRAKARSTSDANPMTQSPPQSPPQSPNPNRPRSGRHSGTFSDVGRHGNDWLFSGYGVKDLAALISPKGQ